MRGLLAATALSLVFSSVMLGQKSSAQKKSAKGPHDTAAVAFASRIGKYSDSAARALDFLADSAADQFKSAIELAHLNHELRTGGIAPAKTTVQTPFSYESLREKASAAMKEGTSLTDAFDAYRAPSGMERMAEQMITALRRASSAADSISSTASACGVRIESPVCTERLPKAISSLKEEIAKYYAARIRAVLELDARGVAPP